MKVPKPKSNVVRSHTLSGLDGVKDVEFGPASVEQRRMGNAKVTGAPADAPETDDQKAMRKRWGFPF